MRKTLWDAAGRTRLIERVGQLQPDASRRWGRMTAPQMLAHLTDWFAMAKGEMVIPPRKHFASRTPLKQILIYVLPIPRGVPTAKELIARQSAEWETEKAELKRQIRLFGDLDPGSLCATHPVFGVMTPRDWGVLGYRHADHHLRQFGV